MRLKPFEGELHVTIASYDEPFPRWDAYVFRVWVFEQGEVGYFFDRCERECPHHDQDLENDTREVWVGPHRLEDEE